MSLSKSRLTEFNDGWLCDQRFQPWLQKVEKDKHVFCSLCRSTLSSSNMGKRAVTSHLNGQKHKSRSRVNSECDLRIFLKKSNTDASTSSQESSRFSQSEESLQENKCAKDVNESENLSFLNTKEIVSQQSVTSRPLQSFLLKNENTKADILWCLLVVMNHWSVNSAGKAVQVFKAMFSDSSIAMNMRLQRTKISYTIVYGLAPYFHKELLQEISQCDFFVISFDESLNKIAQKEQMDIVIRFWSKSKDTVSTHYFTSVFLGHTTAADLIRSFKEAVSELDLRKLMQLSMDGPNVNIKFLADLKADLNRDPSDHVIMEIGLCGLHTLHNAFKVGMNSCEWKIFHFLHAIYNFFKDRPARRSDYTMFSGSTKFPVKFCNVRWLQNFEVAQRALEIIPNLKKYVEGVKENKKEPVMSGSYAAMVGGIRDKLMPAKLAFFCFLVKEIEDFLECFQTDAPMAPFLHTELTNILMSLMKHFVKPETISSKSIASIDLSKSEALLHAKKVDVGYGTRDALRRIDSVKEIDILSFKQDCRTILQTTCKKIIIKSPLKFKLAKGITCCDPQMIVKSPQIAEQRLQMSLEVFVENYWLSGLEAQKIHSNFKEVFQSPEMLADLKNFRRKESRLDEFWTNFVVKHDTSKELVTFIKMVLVFSHGNASVERGFTVNKDCLVENMHERSLIAQRQVWDGVQASGGVVQDLNITKTMILSARNAHSKYQDAQTEQKKSNEDKEKEKDEKKRVADIKNDLEMQKKKKLEELTLVDEQIRGLVKKY
ncbi:uncharacterized protein LOC134542976 [Bacillus rossius redtenbacheri]|uniref:uncharacterized protein LOC134542976 n=1 Tax=Bacillus rossius redtenbacheri TaxID=93214 RepID=UPI002FDDA29B